MSNFLFSNKIANQFNIVYRESFKCSTLSSASRQRPLVPYRSSNYTLTFPIGRRPLVQLTHFIFCWSVCRYINICAHSGISVMYCLASLPFGPATTHKVGFCTAMDNYLLEVLIISKRRCNSAWNLAVERLADSAACSIMAYNISSVGSCKDESL